MKKYISVLQRIFKHNLPGFEGGRKELGVERYSNKRKGGMKMYLWIGDGGKKGMRKDEMRDGGGLEQGDGLK